MNIRWSGAANRARLDQLRYIARDRPMAAERIDTEIERRINNLASAPEMGRLGRVAGTRELLIKGTPFIAVYRVRRDAVEILRFLHGAQRWPPETPR